MKLLSSQNVGIFKIRRNGGHAMSTRAKIAIRRKDGSFQGIYCHFDGYLNYAGEILEKFYDTTEKVEKLISLGNLAKLGFKPADCFAYCRDGGEDLKFWTNEEQFNYTYVEDLHRWMVLYRDSSGTRIEEPLRDALLKRKK